MKASFGELLASEKQALSFAATSGREQPNVVAAGRIAKFPLRRIQFLHHLFVPLDFSVQIDFLNG